MTVFFDSPGLCHGSIAPPTLAPPGELCEKRSVSLKESVVRWSVSIGRGKPYCCACVMLHIINSISKITDMESLLTFSQKRLVVANDFALRQEKSCLTGPLPEEFTPLNLAPIHGIGVLGIDKNGRAPYRLSDFELDIIRRAFASLLNGVLQNDAVQIFQT
jgi:hypothetical protein